MTPLIVTLVAVVLLVAVLAALMLRTARSSSSV